MTRFAVLCVALCLLLSGCRHTGEVENQAYALILGMDRLPDGRLRLTVRVPRIGDSAAADGGKGEKGSKYLTFSAEAEGWPDACEALERATPRPLNLSHMELVVISRVLASQAGFEDLIQRVAQTPHLYTTARLIVCEGSAEAFVKSQDTVIGTRMSAELNAMLTHYIGAGFIPESTLADMYYASRSVYSDPVAIYARLEEASGQETAPGEASSGIPETPMKQRYEGTALFRGGVLVGTLNADQTRALCLIRGNTRSIPLDVDGRAVDLTLEDGPNLRVLHNDRGAVLRVDMRFSASDAVSQDRLRSVSDRMWSVFMDLISHCQSLGIEPFGFSERAAGRFATLREWLDSDWRRQYASADADVRIEIRGQGITF